MKKKMKVWLLLPIDNDSFVKKYGEGQTWGAVVVAKTKKKARKAAAETGGKAWLDKTETYISEVIPEEYEVGAVILDEPPWGFHATPWKKCKHQNKFGESEAGTPIIAGAYKPMKKAQHAVPNIPTVDLHAPQQSDSVETGHLVERSEIDTTGATDQAATDVMPNFIRDKRLGIMVRSTL